MAEAPLIFGLKWAISTAAWLLLGPGDREEIAILAVPAETAADFSEELAKCPTRTPRCGPTAAAALRLREGDAGLGGLLANLQRLGRLAAVAPIPWVAGQVGAVTMVAVPGASGGALGAEDRRTLQCRRSPPFRP